MTFYIYLERIYLPENISDRKLKIRQLNHEHALFGYSFVFKANVKKFAHTHTEE